MGAAARRLTELGPSAAVVKCGHLGGDPVDVLWFDGRLTAFRGPRVGAGTGTNLHGSGCAFASALAAGLALGEPVDVATRRAHDHVRSLLVSALEVAPAFSLRRPAGSQG